MAKLPASRLFFASFWIRLRTAFRNVPNASDRAISPPDISSMIAWGGNRSQNRLVDDAALIWRFRRRILTSATLAVGDDFSHFKRRTGLSRANAVRSPSCW